MHAGAKLKKEPDASPNTALYMYRPGNVFPNGNQMAKIAIAPRQISPVCVLIRPYLSAMPPAISRPRVENLVSLILEAADLRNWRCPIHIQGCQENHTGSSAESLHHHICGIQTEPSEDLQLQTYQPISISTHFQ
jgi:hypothetical protein